MRVLDMNIDPAKEGSFYSGSQSATGFFFVFLFFPKITEKTKKLFSFAFRHSFVFVDFEPSRLATSDRIDTVLPSFTCFDLRRRIRIIGSHTAVAWQRSKADEFISRSQTFCRSLINSGQIRTRYR